MATHHHFITEKDYLDAVYLRNHKIILPMKHRKSTYAILAIIAGIVSFVLLAT